MQPFSKITLQKRGRYKEVFIYYSRHGAKFRESTKVKIFDSGVVDFEGILTKPENHEAIRKIHDMVEDIILNYIRQYDEKPPVQWLRIEVDKAKTKEFTTIESDQIPVTGEESTETIDHKVTEPSIGSINDDLFFYWEDFIEVKRQTTRTEGTIKRYNNFLVTIRKFKEKYKDRGYDKVGLNSLNQAFFNDLLCYMIKEHEYFRSTKTESSTIEIPEVGLSNETIIKRLTDLFEYLGYCKRRKSVDIDLEEKLEYIKISKFKFGVVKQCDSTKWELTLTTEELQFIINLDYYEPQFFGSLSRMQKKYLDILIFMCLQGTAPIDTQKIKETDIVRGKLVGDRRKTRNGFKVELDPVAEQILKGYSYDLKFSDQKFNEAIKKILITAFELYRPYFEDKYDEEYQLVYTQRKSKGDEEFLLIQHKGLFA